MARIVIDARMYGLEHAGIGRYVLNLIKEISRFGWEDGGKKFFLLVRKKNYEEVRALVNNFSRVIVVDIPHYSLREQIFLPFILAKLKPDLVHFPHFNVPLLWFGRYVVTIHDLIKHKSRGVETTTHWPIIYWLKYLAYRFLIKMVVRSAVKIITPSQWWKDELVKRYHLPPEKIFVTYEGVEKTFRFLNPPSGSDSQILKKFGLKKPFVVYTGSLYPHKNISRLVEAIDLLNSSESLNLSLAIVCARNIFYHRFLKKLAGTGKDKYIKLLGFIPDGELIRIYRQAEAFVFPSLLEGFGLPGLEAMASGLPVVSSNFSCLPEIYGQAALYFNPLEIKDMAQKIKSVISNRRLRENLVKEGFRQIKKYSWLKMAKETMTVYELALQA